MPIELIACMPQLAFDNNPDIHFGCKFKLDGKIVMIELVRPGDWHNWDVGRWCDQSGREAMQKLADSGLDVPSTALLQVYASRRMRLYKSRSDSEGTSPELIGELPGRLSRPADSPD